MLLNRLQRHLENIYEVQSSYRVADFVIDDPGLARRLDTTPNARELPEKLLIHEDGESLNVALYLDPDLLRRLDADDPTESLHGHNLHDFWMALEGISHFLYLTWNAGHARSVSLLEMELQAEVDKYILAAFLFGRQMQGVVPKTLHGHLFHNASFDHRLDAAERHRYRSANYFAGRFCSYIEKEFLQPGARGGLVNTLRRFYRLTQQRKIKAIRHL
ncbi:MAG: hypothetical protein PVI91_00765 [Gammaproteobacteria bacterium]|jgi:hypothetical protein